MTRKNCLCADVIFLAYENYMSLQKEGLCHKSDSESNFFDGFAGDEVNV